MSSLLTLALHVWCTTITMNYREAIQIMERLQTGDAEVQWVSPILSTMLAAWSIEHECNVRFAPVCASYADNIGLSFALSGQMDLNQRSGALHGKTYSPLTSLWCHAQVESCNSIINDVIRTQIHHSELAPLVARLCKVVGELHDNVASHARGRGFSAAQIYKQTSGSRRVEFAIADSGCGLLRNARRVAPEVTNDYEAIDWAIRKGTTSAKRQQRTYEFWDDPYEYENHHMGLGLWELDQLVTIAGGQLWVASGAGQRFASRGEWRPERPSIDWPGLAIEFELPLDVDDKILARLRDVADSYPDLARELGI